MSNLAKYFIGAGVAVALVLAFSFSKTTSSVVPEKNQHRIVFHLTTSDTAAYHALAKQLNNVLAYWPDAQLEVVAHNKGIGMLVKDKTNVQTQITALKARGVRFNACENTMKSQKLEKSQIVAEAGFVPVGLAEIVERQEQGWAYIKAGF